MYCSVAKSPGIPILRSFSDGSCQIGLKHNSRYFSTFLSMKTFVCVPGGRTLGIENHLIGVRTIRGFSTDHYRRSRGKDYGEVAGKRLPWIASAAANSAKKVKKIYGKIPEKESKSPWEESASKYFSKSQSGDVVEDKSSNVSFESGRRQHSVGTYIVRRSESHSEEEDGAEPVDDRRWDTIKRDYSRIGSREARHERPEVSQWKKQESWGRKTWREASESSIPKMVGESVYGVGPILAALTIGRRDFYALYVQEGMDLNGNNKKKKKKDKKGVENIFKMAEKLGLSIKQTSKHDLNMIVDNRPHQGLVLDASPLEMVSIKELDPLSSIENSKKSPVWVALDEVTDPQNLGAILRSSYFFGVEGVILCAKNSAPLSGVVSKASAGALELLELRSCKNMMQFLTSSVENGWRVLGGSVSISAVPLNEVHSDTPTILVLGSEGSGLRPLVERSCTHLIKIPGKPSAFVNAIRENEEIGSGDDVDVAAAGGGRGGEEGLKSFLAVESLNVSVATGVLLYHLVGNNNT